MCSCARCALTSPNPQVEVVIEFVSMPSPPPDAHSPGIAICW
jgi:hypothetical protein